MVAVTDFCAVDPSGKPVQADAWGNNAAIKCERCGHPVLALAVPHQRGSSAENPSVCRSCGLRLWMEVDETPQRLVVHTLPSPRFVVGRPGRHTATANIKSWSVVQALMDAYGGAGYDELCLAVRQHNHPPGTSGKAFIDYCIRNGWLVPENAVTAPAP